MRVSEMKAILSGSRVSRFPKGSGKRALSVARQIVEDIEQQGAAVGDRLLPEQEMLLRYGVARATLREALRFLELQGINGVAAAVSRHHVPFTD